MKWQSTAEKTPKNFSGYFNCRTLYIPAAAATCQRGASILNEEDVRGRAMTGRCYSGGNIDGSSIRRVDKPVARDTSSVSTLMYSWASCRQPGSSIVCLSVCPSVRGVSNASHRNSDEVNSIIAWRAPATIASLSLHALGRLSAAALAPSAQHHSSIDTQQQQQQQQQQAGEQ